MPGVAVPLPVGTGRDGLLLPNENIGFLADGSDVVLSSFFSSAAPNEKAGLDDEEESSFFADVVAVPAPNEKPVLAAAAESSFFSSGAADEPKLKPTEVLLAANLESSSSLLSRLRLGFAGVVAGIFVDEEVVPNEKPLFPIAAFFVVDGGAPLLAAVPNENPELPILADDPPPSFSSPSSLSLTRFALAGVALPKVLLLPPPPPLTVSTSFLFALLAAKRDSVLAKALAAGEGSDTADDDDFAVVPKENPLALIEPLELVAFFFSSLPEAVLLFVTPSLPPPGLGASHDKQFIASLGFFV